MKKEAPKLTTFVICDQVRLETNKKITVMGWYTGNKIVFHPKKGARLKAPFRMLGLGFVLVLDGGSGLFETTVEITGPSGKPMLKPTKMDPMKLERDKSAFMAIQLANPQFEAVGDYALKVRLGEKRYTQRFAVETSKEPVNPG